VAIDLNADLGDGRTDPDDIATGQLLTIVSSVNIACGGHAGDSDSMTAACELASRSEAAIGAHVSFRDREGFGQRRMDVTGELLSRQLVGQIEVLDEAALTAGSSVTYVKPHGALYHGAADDPELAKALIRAIELFGERTGRRLAMLGPPGGALGTAAESAGVRAFGEVVIDRTYLPDGRTMPRTAPGAVLVDPIEVEARLHTLLREGTIRASDGSVIEIAFRSIRLSAGTPADLMLARRLHSAIVAERVRIAPFALRRTDN